jgi:argininosuccinate lyase
VNSNATNFIWQKAWAGRFEKANAPLMEQFNQSIGVDIRLWDADIRQNIAWARALGKIGMLSPNELAQIEQGLQNIWQEFATNQFLVLPNDEDIHLAVERRLTEMIGAPAGKLHTGRSRNDQVVTDFRLWLKAEIPGVNHFIQQLQTALVKIAEENREIILPGYTHLQQAQPVLLAHYLLSFVFGLQRNRERLADCTRRVDVLPLGSGALAGSAFWVDREFLAQELGFSKISENSIDAVSDRDFVLEFVSVLTQIQLLLSRYAEDLIIWHSLEFGFIELDDAWATGSSMMPQKKNPDSLELIRGKAAQLIGAQTQLASLLKGLPLTYAKDLQDDKAITFVARDTVNASLEIFTGVIASLKINASRMEAALDSRLLATDVADYLTRKGIPFRKCHEIVGQLVKYSLAQECSLAEIPLEIYQKASPAFAEDVFEIFDWQRSTAQRNLPGGTGRESVEGQIRQARVLIGQ